MISPWRQVLLRDTLFPVAVICGGVFIHALNIFILPPVLPTVVEEIGGISYYALASTMFILASIIGSAYVTKIFRSFGARNAYYVSTGLFIAGSIICALSPNLPVLIGGRILQGFGGGLMVALSYALLNATIERRLWSRIMSVVSSMWGFATLFGPALGGYLAETGQWRMTFWLLIPAAMLVVIGAQYAFPREDSNGRKMVPVANLQLIVLSIAVLFISISSLTTEIVSGGLLLLCGIGLIVFFSRIEKRAQVRLLPKGSVDMLKPYGMIFGVISIIALVVIWSNVFVSYFLQNIHGQSPLVAGYIAALVAGGWTLASFVTPGMTGRNANIAVFLSPVLMLSGTLILLVMMIGDGAFSNLDLAITCIGVFLMGAGPGAAWPHITTWAMSDAPRGDGDLASSAIVLVQNAAMAVGAAMAGLIANSSGLVDPGGAEGARVAALWVYGVLCIPALGGIILAYGLVRQR